MELYNTNITVFCVCLPSLSIMVFTHAKAIYVVMVTVHVIAEYYPIVCMNHMYHYCLSIHQLMGIWIVFSFGVLGTMLPWLSVYKSFCGHMFLLSLGRYSEVKFLDCMVNLHFTFEGTAKLFSKVVVFSTSNTRGFQSLPILTSHITVCLLITVIPVGKNVNIV